MTIEKPSPRVLVVLPESSQGKQLVAYLGRRGFETLWAHDGQSAYEVLDTEPLDALRRHGPCPLHRRSFAPVLDVLSPLLL